MDENLNDQTNLQLSPRVKNFFDWAASSIFAYSVVSKSVLRMNEPASIGIGQFHYIFTLLPTEFGKYYEKVNEIIDSRNKTMENFKGALKLELAYYDNKGNAHYKFGGTDFVAFVYLSETSLSPELLNNIADFDGVKKGILTGCTEMNCYYDLSTGNYTIPKKLGFSARLPLKKMLKNIENNVFKPYSTSYKSEQAKQIIDQIISLYKKNLTTETISPGLIKQYNQLWLAGRILTMFINSKAEAKQFKKDKKEEDKTLNNLRKALDKLSKS